MRHYFTGVDGDKARASRWNRYHERMAKEYPFKVCVKCKERKHIDEFFNQSRGLFGKRSVCKVCSTAMLRNWEDRNPAKISRIRTGYYAKIRDRVYLAYGNKCRCCGVEEKAFLSLDHVNNDGKKHRNELGGAGIVLYLWAIRNNFPPILQLLCMNCNHAKSRLGECPHETARKIAVMEAA
jgi:hypothetical protein